MPILVLWRYFSQPGRHCFYVGECRLTHIGFIAVLVGLKPVSIVVFLKLAQEFYRRCFKHGPSTGVRVGAVVIAVVLHARYKTMIEARTGATGKCLSATTVSCNAEPDRPRRSPAITISSYNKLRRRHAVDAIQTITGVAQRVCRLQQAVDECIDESIGDYNHIVRSTSNCV